jgi:glucosyl-dolichyl phosphate glucuronosyltransferase
MSCQISVLVCTWNRAALLEETLGHLALAQPPTVPWELVVVDNNSDDATPEVIRKWQRRLPLRGVFEARPGIAHARNAALDAARGPCMVWADDDVAIPPHWLTEYQAAFASWPQTGLFGGPIRPRFEGEPPRWLREIWDKVAIIYGECDYGDSELPLEAPARLPFGANFAVRRSAVQGRHFNPQLGRQPHGRGALSEETTLFVQLLEQGGEGRWVPRAAVRHWVPKEKQSVAYIRRQYELYGKTCLLNASVGDAARLVGTLPRWAVRRAIENEVRYRAARLTGRPRQWIEPLMEASAAWGVVKFCSGRL